jgi:hypothetical protein
MTTDNATCPCDPDDPCFCPIETPVPRHRVRFSAKATEAIRRLSGDRRWPLRPAQPEGDAS